jgi:hypothetical protein
MQPLTHNGSWQWRQETAKLTSPLSSIFMRGFILPSFSALAISFSFVPEKAQ